MIDHPDEMIPVVAGIITLVDGKTGTAKGSYWDITKSGQFEVHVTTHKYGTKLWALLPTGGKGGVGMWMIPPPGTEVFVSFDHGDMEADGGIIGMFGQPPGVLAPGTILIIDDHVEIRSVNGTAQPLAYKSDVQAVDAKYASHIHLQADGSAATQGPGSLPLINNPGTPPPVYTGSTPLAAANIVGTSVLKGE